jgi:hypothetical protein
VTNPILVALRDIVDPDPCHLDHHGYCQAHGWTGDEPCPHARAKDLLAAEPAITPVQELELRIERMCDALLDQLHHPFSGIGSNGGGIRTAVRAIREAVSSAGPDHLHHALAVIEAYGKSLGDNDDYGMGLLDAALRIRGNHDPKWEENAERYLPEDDQ